MSTHYHNYEPQEFYWNTETNTLCPDRWTDENGNFSGNSSHTNAKRQELVDDAKETNTYFLGINSVKRYTLKRYAEVFGFDLSDVVKLPPRKIKSFILNRLPYTAFMVAVSLECRGNALWVALGEAIDFIERSKNQ